MSVDFRTESMSSRRLPLSRLILAGALALAATGCSVRTMAVKSLADSLAAGGDVWASDEDPELVRDALPFALKTYESLLAEAPHHQGLLLATCAGFTQYASAFVEGEALYLAEAPTGRPPSGSGSALCVSTCAAVTTACERWRICLPGSLGGSNWSRRVRRRPSRCATACRCCTGPVRVVGLGDLGGARSSRAGGRCPGGARVDGEGARVG